MNNQTIEPEIGPCPLCHVTPQAVDGLTRCLNDHCELYGYIIHRKAWNRLSRLAEQEPLSRKTLENARWGIRRLIDWLESTEDNMEEIQEAKAAFAEIERALPLSKG